MNPNLDDLSMLEVFQLEAEEHLRQLTRDAMAIEAGESDDQTLRRMMRELHTLKGSARLVELHQIKDLAHILEQKLEDATEARKDLSRDEVSGFLHALDGIEAVITACVRSRPHRDLTPMLRLLESQGLASVAESAGPAPDADVDAAEAHPAPPEEPAGLEHPEETAEDSFVRVPARLLTRLLTLAGELHVSHLSLNRVLRHLQGLSKPLALLDGDWRQMSALYLDQSPAAELRKETLLRSNSRAGGVVRKEFDHSLSTLDELLEQVEWITGRLNDAVLQARMLPIQSIFEPFPRLVRDLSNRLGRSIHFTTSGGKTKVDRDVLEGLREPLLHLVQNAIDHGAGAESPDKRRSRGKPPETRISLEAQFSGDYLLVSVEDDGPGVDLERVRQVLVTRNLATENQAGSMTEGQLIQFLFSPGFTTSRQVTQLSGRGVGLDAVKAAVSRLKGRLDLDLPGEGGTRITMRLPLSMAVTSVLLARASGVLFAIPISQIDQVMSVRASDLQIHRERQVLYLEDECVQYNVLTRQLGMPDALGWMGEDHCVMVLRGERERIAVAVDRFLEEEDVIVKPLDSRLGKVRCLLGAAVASSGDVALVLDVPDLLTQCMQAPPEGASSDLARSLAGRRRILLVEDSRTAREVYRRLLTGAGYDVDTTQDGLEALDRLNRQSYDLVLTDVNMPGMDGLSLTRRIRAEERLRHLPIIILTYKSRDADRQRGIDAGASVYMAKDRFERQELLRTVATLLAASRSAGDRSEERPNRV